MDEHNLNSLWTFYGDKVGLMSLSDCKAVKQEDLDEIEKDGGKAEVVGGYSIRFDDVEAPMNTDLTGQWFSKSTYLGPKDGAGVDVYFHHGYPIYDERIADVVTRELSEKTFGEAKVTRDEIGIWAEAVLDIRDDYEARIAEMAEKGTLGWSSASAGHLVRIDLAEDNEALMEKFYYPGHIRRWPVIEHSLTPSPAETRNTVQAIRSVKSEPFLREKAPQPTPSPVVKDDPQETEPKADEKDVTPNVVVQTKIVVFDMGALTQIRENVTDLKNILT